MTMNAHEFVKAIEGKTGLLVRTCCATGHIEEEREVTAELAVCNDRGNASIAFHSIHCYGPQDLFTHDRGSYVAVVKTGAGHIYADRFTVGKCLTR